jgi:hypothetical protein
MLGKFIAVLSTVILVTCSADRVLAAEISCVEYRTNAASMAANPNLFKLYPSGRKPTAATCRRMLLQGPIEPGDAQKFSMFLKAHHPFVSRLYLSSPGGSVADAIAIGRLTRAALIETRAPDHNFFGGDWRAGNFDTRPGSGILYIGRWGRADNRVLCRGPSCNCASACFLIWAGGWERWGSVLGIHRPTAGMNGFGNLPPDKASVAYTQIISAIRDYLSEMEIPNRYMERMTSISSDNMFWISENVDELKALDELEYAPSIQEWLKLKCGVSKFDVNGGCEALAILNARDSKHF